MSLQNLPGFVRISSFSGADVVAMNIKSLLIDLSILIHSVLIHEPCGRLFCYLLHSYSMLSIHSAEGEFSYIDQNIFLIFQSASLFSNYKELIKQQVYYLSFSCDNIMFDRSVLPLPTEPDIKQPFIIDDVVVVVDLLLLLLVLNYCCCLVI